VVGTVRAGGRPECMIRVFVSRGPGGFGVNPYECPASQLYVVVTALGTPFMQVHPEGARLKTSVVPAKTAEMANIKNCNYAPNVLMKKEAVDAKVDFTIGFDENGYLTEGSTENLGIVTRDGRLLFPHLDRILTGTTMLRAMELAKALIGKGILKSVAFADITHADMLAAAEVLVAGTTINIASAVELDGKLIADGKPGPVAAALDELLRRDMRENQGLLTKVF
jgi:branched-subunit amino acid aminotransferase/4-amino-4-deoxychorismate lyase